MEKVGRWVGGGILMVSVGVCCSCRGKGWCYFSVGGVCHICLVLEDGDGGCS